MGLSFIHTNLFYQTDNDKLLTVKIFFFFFKVKKNQYCNEFCADLTTHGQLRDESHSAMKEEKKFEMALVYMNILNNIINNTIVMKN